MTDPYEAVLADLRAKRDQIDQTIVLLSALRGKPSLSVQRADVPQDDPEGIADAGAYLGMSIPEAAKKLLAARKQAMPNADIHKELVAGGMVLTGNDPVNVISSVLTRRFNQVGDIVRVARGTWGLKEWYPGRSFNKSLVKVPVPPDSPATAVYAVQINDLGSGPICDDDDDL